MCPVLGLAHRWIQDVAWLQCNSIYPHLRVPSIILNSIQGCVVFPPLFCECIVQLNGFLFFFWTVFLFQKHLKTSYLSCTCTCTHRMYDASQFALSASVVDVTALVHLLRPRCWKCLVCFAALIEGIFKCNGVLFCHKKGLFGCSLRIPETKPPPFWPTHPVWQVWFSFPLAEDVGAAVWNGWGDPFL